MKKKWVKQGIVLILIFLSGMCLGDILVSKKNEQKIKNMRQNIERLKEYFDLMHWWIYVKQRGVTIAQWLEQNGYKKIIIYGMKEIGTCLYNELIDTNIEIVCCIDQNKDNVLGEFDVIDLNDEIPSADMVIVTPVYYFASIKSGLQAKVACPIISFDFLLQNVFVNGCQWK